MYFVFSLLASKKSSNEILGRTLPKLSCLNSQHYFASGDRNIAESLLS